LAGEEIEQVSDGIKITEVQKTVRWHPRYKLDWTLTTTKSTTNYFEALRA